MPRALTTEHPVVTFQLFKHIAITDLGAHKFHTTRLQSHFHRHVRHQRADDTRHMFIATHSV
ncbi:hypothetical protein D3C71_1850910 [compost metagenome]